MISVRILVLHSVLLTAISATDICSKKQYLSPSKVCVDCTPCNGPKEFISRPCHLNGDTICGSITEWQKTSNTKLNKNKKPHVPFKNTTSKKSASIEKKDNTFYENARSYNFMLHREDGKLRKNNTTVKVKNAKHKTSEPLNSKDNIIELLNSKIIFNKNNKHIKKDLSNFDEINPESLSFKKAVKSTPDVTKNSSVKKDKSKQQKIQIDESSSHNEWMHHTSPHAENEKMYVDLHHVKFPDSVFKSLKKKDADLLDSEDDDDDDYDDEDDDYDTSMNKSDENGNNDDDGEDDDEADDDDNDDDIHTDNKGTPENEDDEDTQAEDDDDDDDDNEDIDEDEDNNEEYSSSPTKLETKFKPFGVQPDISVDDIEEDENYLDEQLPKGVEWPSTNEVNVEPFIDTSNWQLLILVSAVSACLLFFVVVNAYLCIYMKKWKHMKQDFEADVEDLSARINLMQHAGFEADESSNMRNYITLLKGGKGSTEKVSKPVARS